MPYNTCKKCGKKSTRFAHGKCWKIGGMCPKCFTYVGSEKTFENLNDETKKIGMNPVDFYRRVVTSKYLESMK